MDLAFLNHLIITITVAVAARDIMMIEDHQIPHAGMKSHPNQINVMEGTYKDQDQVQALRITIKITHLKDVISHPRMEDQETNEMEKKTQIKEEKEMIGQTIIVTIEDNKTAEATEVAEIKRITMVMMTKVKEVKEEVAIIKEVNEEAKTKEATKVVRIREVTEEEIIGLKEMDTIKEVIPMAIITVHLKEVNKTIEVIEVVIEAIGIIKIKVAIEVLKITDLLKEANKTTITHIEVANIMEILAEGTKMIDLLKEVTTAEIKIIHTITADNKMVLHNRPHQAVLTHETIQEVVKIV